MSHHTSREAAMRIYEFTAPSKRARMNDLLYDYSNALAHEALDALEPTDTGGCICTDDTWDVGCPIPGHGWGASREFIRNLRLWGAAL